MNKKANYIKQRLSLREPLQEALDILVQVADSLSLSKNPVLIDELNTIKKLYPSCTDFEREFPSICFSIATGVGKTRLMGACVSWLYLEKGIKNFFVLAPNLTIYEKLIKDFGDPGFSKYVFKGISEFVHNPPVVITGENYNQAGGIFKEQEIVINIFNVSKFNSENRGTRSGGRSLPPRMKRLSEYLGESYWDYLSNLDDLVILMDEAHRYHADASKNAINELKPILGIELTATPIDENGNLFKNVVYEYSLARALSDGKYVKQPAIATRKNFRSSDFQPDEIEKIKLEDAVSIHEDTKNELELYALNNRLKKVKPFMLVVCRDINHAKEVFDYITSAAFYSGAYKGKVLQIDSSTRRDDDIERAFVELEQYDNEIEIVIHVNMLKEGWDVNNLYTIVPLRAANAGILIEQTIGRGLRLPYNGERTGVEKVDKLTVLAHDNFERVIEESQNPESTLNKLTYIELDEEELKERKVVTVSVNKNSLEIFKEEKRIEQISDRKERQDATATLEATKLIVDVIPEVNTLSGLSSVKDLLRPVYKERILSKIEGKLEDTRNLFTDEIIASVSANFENTIKKYINNTIEIPRMDLVQGETKIRFADFDLDTSKGFDYHPLNDEIIVLELTGERRTDTVGVQYGAYLPETPANQIVSELMNYPEIDYDEWAELLHKLAYQALNYIEGRLEDKGKLGLVIRQYRKFIAARIYEQLARHMETIKPEYSEPRVFPFVKIEDWSFTSLKDQQRPYSDVVSPKALIPKILFFGFEKACHFEYKFDSSTEQDFAYILDKDNSVLKWMRPAQNQFRIYWANNSRQYHPDFVVETEEGIYMVETKEAGQLDTEEVQDKKRAALEYCKHATNFTSKNGGKPWKYLLIPHDYVARNNSFDYFKRFAQ